MVKRMELPGLQLRYVHRDGSIHIQASSSTTSRSIKLAQQLEAAIENRVPFRYVRRGEPKIQILWDPTSEGFLAVELDIAPPTRMREQIAIQQLQEADFIEGFYPTR